MGHERINEVLQIKDPKNGSKFKRLLREPNHDKIVDFLTEGKGKRNSTKKQGSGFILSLLLLFLLST